MSIRRPPSRCVSCAACATVKARHGCKSGSPRLACAPINVLVDITNYLSFDRARPLHVFDASKVRGDLVIRRASEGESLVALDGRTYALDSEMVVIADDAGVQSLAGVMGGAATGCDEATTDVLIESALWDPANIARDRPEAGGQFGCALSF